MLRRLIFRHFGRRRGGRRGPRDAASRSPADLRGPGSLRRCRRLIVEGTELPSEHGKRDGDALLRSLPWPAGIPSGREAPHVMRIGDAERDAAAADLGEHFTAGRLTLEELHERLEAVFAAKTIRPAREDHVRPPRAGAADRARPARPAPGDAGNDRPAVDARLRARLRLGWRVVRRTRARRWARPGWIPAGWDDRPAQGPRPGRRPHRRPRTGRASSPPSRC